MELMIEELGRCEEGIYVSGFIRMPTRDTVPGLRNRNGMTEADRKAALDQLTEYATELIEGNSRIQREAVRLFHEN